jgi:hypothetical protein
VVINVKIKIMFLLTLTLFLAGAVLAQAPYIILTATPTITPLIEPTQFGGGFTNLTSNGFNIFFIPIVSLTPYTYPTMGDYTIPVFLILFGCFFAMWWGGQNLKYVTMVGMLFSGFLLYAQSGSLGTMLPPGVAGIIYGVFIASCAGLLLSVFKTV